MVKRLHYLLALPCAVALNACDRPVKESAQSESRAPFEEATTEAPATTVAKESAAPPVAEASDSAVAPSAPLKAAAAAAPATEESAEPVSASVPLSFNTHIQPILSEYCYHCHGPDSGTREPKSAPLRLDREKYAFETREDGVPVIVKGKPEESLLIQLIKTRNPDEIMPPPKSHKELNQEQIALLEQWVKEGAPYEEHWSFIPPKKSSLPEAKIPADVHNPVDTFIQSKLAEVGLTPASLEDPRALIRRVTLDLTGLLPKAEDVEAYAANPTQEAYDAYLEKLFATTAYAEHRTRYWLDYSRYGDTHGLHFDNVRSIWPYRDYVIKSFAEHKPYDQFVREQLAGDLIPATSADPWIATGYIRCNVSTNEGGTIPEEVHANNTRDRAEAFGAAFLGLTVGCASCHDHKFDPTSQKDFYSLAAFFNNTSEKPWDENIADSQPVLRLPPDESKRAEFDAAVARRSKADMELARRKEIAESAFVRWVSAGNKPTPVSTDGLAVRLKLDEGSGDVVKNVAPSGKGEAFKSNTNPIVWGEYVWFWPSARMDINTILPLGEHGDFESTQAFSAASWVNLRVKPANVQTGNGALLSRMGDSTKDAHRGWDLFIDGDKLVVHIIHQWPEHAIRVHTGNIPRGNWVHLGFSYDGSRKASGVKLFVNGEERPVEITHDTLQPGQTIRNQLAMHLGRRDGSDPVSSEPMRETAFQDTRLYQRQLDSAEFARLPFEDPAAEILATTKNPQEWTRNQKFVVLDRYFMSVEEGSKRLREEVVAADQQIAELGKGGQATLIARERDIPASAWVLDRGVYTARKELVAPSIPEFLQETGDATSRLELAEWLFKPENPLFARVTVNRIWQEVFGIGIVETADDFGIMGARPVHPELLDWLAVEFRESGWDVKHIYKLLLTSRAYMQSNEVTETALAADPANRLISRGPRFRMDAEMLRDTALQASGLLVAKAGGPPVKPYQPEGIWEAVSMPESDTLHYKQDSGEALYRRSMYSFWKRFAPPPSMETFDAQAREVVCIRRARTNTPLQALVSMNDPQFFEAARKLAERVIRHDADTGRRMDFLAKTLLSRALSPAETDALGKGLTRFSEHYKNHPQDAAQVLTTGEAPPANDLDPVEVAIWTMMANQFLNLDETLTK